MRDGKTRTPQNKTSKKYKKKGNNNYEQNQIDDRLGF